MLIFDLEYFFKSFPQLIVYLPATFAVIGVSLFLATIISIVLVIMKLGRNRVLKGIANGYTTVMRCTPNIVMLFLVYYGLPKIMMAFGLDINDWSRFFFVTTTFALMNGGILSEVMRSAYEAIPKGQMEAALTVGLTTFQALRRILIPQAFVVALPNIGNTVIALLKNGSLAFTIGFIDIMGQATMLIARRFGAFPLETYAALALIYWVVCILLEQLMKAWEEQLEKRKIKAVRK